MDQILSSWKEIAAYFGKGVRTVQRWEQSLGLPVRRPVGAAQNIVFARTSELHQWLEDARSGLSQADSIKTILLMETDEESGSHRRSILEENGFIVFACRTTERALEIFKRGPRVDLLIADIEVESGVGPRVDELLLLASSIPAIALRQEQDGDVLAQSGWHFVSKNESDTGLIETVQGLFAEQEARKRVKVISFPSITVPETPLLKAGVS